MGAKKVMRLARVHILAAGLTLMTLICGIDSVSLGARTSSPAPEGPNEGPTMNKTLIVAALIGAAATIAAALIARGGARRTAQKSERAVSVVAERVVDRRSRGHPVLGFCLGLIVGIAGYLFWGTSLTHNSNLAMQGFFALLAGGSFACAILGWALCGGGRSAVAGAIGYLLAFVPAVFIVGE